ncbi:MAG: hypothetical protein KGL39_12145 [Patescibacteria group bacterium]|nr:hypothetical protein [Patescibacteria group bacterium]
MGNDHRAGAVHVRSRMERQGLIVLLDTSDDLLAASQELGMSVGQLLTPLTRFRNRGGKFAIDNGAFAGFQRQQFLSLLEREYPNRNRCLFVVVPDVVGSARRTLEVFERWLPMLAGWPLALAAQDGQEDLPIPWDSLSALFIGGTTKFKMSQEAEAIIRAAQELGKWVHVGRVNTPARMDRFLDLGVDSCDGTGLSRFSWMRKEVADLELQPKLIGAV